MVRALVLSVVSMPQQAAEDAESLAEQSRLCRAACIQRGWEMVEEITLPGQSRDFDRLDDLLAVSPAYGRIFSLAESGAIDLVVVRHIDRLARTTALFVEVTTRLRRAGVQVFSVAQPEEPVPSEMVRRRGTSLTPFVLSWAGEQQNLVRVQRRHTGMRGRIRRGLHAGTSTPPYGYRHVGPDQPLEVVPEEGEIVKWLFSERAKGAGYSSLTRQLNGRGIPPPSRGQRWHQPAVKRLLGNPIYRGQVVYHQWPDGRENGGTPEVITAQGQHEPLVDEATWEAAQSVARRRLRAPRIDRTQWPLTSLCRCAFCGRNMTYKVRRWTRKDGTPREAISLVCSAYQHAGECQPNHHRASEVHYAVLGAVGDALADRSVLLADLAQRDGDAHALVGALRARVTDLKGRIARILDLAEAGAMTPQEAARRRSELQRDLNAVRADLAAQEDVAAQAAAREERWDRAATAFAAAMAALGPFGENTPEGFVPDEGAQDNASGWVEALAALPPGEGRILPGEGIAALREVLFALVDHLVLEAGQDPVIIWR